MFNADGSPYMSKLEEACVMFIEPSEAKDAKTCRISLVTMAKIMKAYSDLDETYSDV